MSINENCDPILPIQKPDKGKDTFEKRKESVSVPTPTRKENVSSTPPKSRNTTRTPTNVNPAGETPSRKSTPSGETGPTTEAQSIPRNKPTGRTAIRRRRTSGHAVGSPPYKEDKGGFKEPPTQHGKIQGEEIEEDDEKCDCDDEEIETEEDQTRNEQKRTIYPHNQVYQSESGHFVEFDDTPGSERISVNHRLGSFVEFHPTGDVVHKVAGDLHYSVIRDSHIHVNGYTEITVDKALKIYVNAKENENTEEKALNFDIHIGKNSNINIFVEKGDLNISVDKGNANIKLEEGDINLTQEKGNYNHYVNGDYNLQCTGNMHTVVDGNVVHEIEGSRSTRVGGKLDHLELSGPESVLEFDLEDWSVRGRNKYSSLRNFYTKVEDNYEIYSENDIRIRAEKNIHILSSEKRDGFLTLSSFNGEVRILSEKDFHLKTLTGKAFFDIGANQLHVKSEKVFKNWELVDGPSSAQFFTKNRLRLKQEEDQQIKDILLKGFENVTINWTFTIQK
jgi:hypothetical protein